VVSQDYKIGCYSVLDGNFQENYVSQGSSTIALRTAISPDGYSFATADSGNSVKLWNLNDGHMTQQLVPKEAKTWVWDVAFTPDSRKVVTGSSDGVCKMFDTETGKLERQFEKLDTCVSCILVFST
jgi:WD40 repeat protein